jgi:predicted DNA-binding protein with PD1-like motif
MERVENDEKEKAWRFKELHGARWISIFHELIGGHLRYQHQNILKNYLLRLYRGEDIFKEIEKFCENNGINGGIIHGMGAVSKAILGFFDGQKYLEIVFDENLEILALSGNIAKGERPIIHLHGVFGRIDGSSIGGHIFPGCIVSVTCEINILQSEPPPKRSKDQSTGLNLLDLPEK